MMPSSAALSDQVVVVTGGGTGIGAATAHRFAREGATVVVVGRTAEKLARTVAQAPFGSTIVRRTADVRDEKAVCELVDGVVAEFGRLNTLINCAGVAAMGSVEQLDAATWRDVTRINLDAVYFASKAALPYLKGTRGSIVNVGSSAALRSNYTQAAYNATKSAAASLSTSMAIDHGAEGVRVNTVHPGVVYPTEITAPFDDNPEMLAAFEASIPLGRTGTPDEIAAAIAFLASPEASYINGAALPVDGGLNQVSVLPRVP